MENLLPAVQKLCETGALLAIGHKLRTSGLLRQSDGQTAIQVATYATLPSAILHAFTSQGPLTIAQATGFGVAAICLSAQIAANWLYCYGRSKREQAVLAGTATGLSLPLYGYPLIQTVFGLDGLRTLAVVDLLNNLAVWVASYKLFALAGPAFPEAYKHEDGGVYRGQWRGMVKDGLGIYTYASGAKYEGEWRDNIKDGRGVYYFPSGGTYEGDWSNGAMNGVGIRTFASGKVKAGRWREGQLEQALEVWQCANAAEGAAEAALAARRVEVGGGRWKDAVQLLISYPPFWAVLAGLALNALQLPLPASLEVVASELAKANAPLLLLAAGITLPAWKQPESRMVTDVVRMVGTRLLIPLVVAGSLLAALGQELAAYAAPITIVCLAFLTPCPPTAEGFAHRFRLNESLAASLTLSSTYASLPLLATLSLVALTSGVGTTAVSTFSSWPLFPNPMPLAIACLSAVAAISAAVAYLTRGAELQPVDQRVRMVYAGPAGAAIDAQPPSTGSQAVVLKAGGSAAGASMQSISPQLPPASAQGGLSAFTTAAHGFLRSVLGHLPAAGTDPSSSNSQSGPVGSSRQSNSSSSSTNSTSTNNSTNSSSSSSSSGGSNPHSSSWPATRAPSRTDRSPERGSTSGDPGGVKPDGQQGPPSSSAQQACSAQRHGFSCPLFASQSAATSYCDNLTRRLCARTPQHLLRTRVLRNVANHTASRACATLSVSGRMIQHARPVAVHGVARKAAATACLGGLHRTTAHRCPAIPIYLTRLQNHGSFVRPRL